MTTRIFLVDDHEIVRRGLFDLLGGVEDFVVVGEAASVGKRWLRYRRATPTSLFSDVRLPDGNGVELCRELRSMLPDLRCLMLTSYADDEALLDMIMAGASDSSSSRFSEPTWSLQSAQSGAAVHCSTVVQPRR